MKKTILFEGQKHSLYEYQQKLGLSRGCLYHYTSGKYKIKNMPAETILGIAYIEKIEANDLLKRMKEYEAKRNGNI